ncbi:hypothetical protein [Anabaena sp. CCY 9910]|uniref:hypothetical protein n=1 Tax=Anabaena sp. CCY 9910 TaxID=3103870 RepID=UPI0039E06229
MTTKQVNEFDIAFDFRMCRGDAKLVADTINQWKCGPAAVIHYSSFGMNGEDFRVKIKPIMDGIVHDALLCGYQVFFLNRMGDWEAFPDLEEPVAPKGYWWMRILYERSSLQVSILAPSYRAYKNQVWEAIAS